MKIYQSEILQSIHEDAEAMYEVGGITKAEMYEYDEGCLMPKAVAKVRQAREGGAVASPAPSYQPSARPVPVFASGR
jgi:DNA-binding transcriptional regulator YiaG